MDTLYLERAILANILQNPDLLIDLDLDGRTNLDSFKSPINKEILSAAVRLYNSGYSRMDKEMVYNNVFIPQEAGLDSQQLFLYIESLFRSDISQVNFSQYLDDLNDAHLKFEARLTLQSGLQTLAGAKDMSATEFLGRLQDQLYQLEASTIRSDDPIEVSRTIADDIYSRLCAGDKNFGIPTGIEMLDESMLGWKPKKFYFISARSGEGKSAFLLQSAVHAALFARRNKTRVLYIDTEIDTSEFNTRMVGHIAGVDTLDILRGMWTHSSLAAKNVDYAVKLIKDHGGIYHKYMPGYTRSSLINMIKKYVYNYGIGLVVFDYLKMPRGDEDMERWQKVGSVASALKDLSGILDVPIISALQQNKKGANHSRVSTDAFAESDDPLKESDGAFALNRKSATEISEETIQAGTHRLQILKGRYFKSNYGGINLRFIGYCLRFLVSPIQETEEDYTHDSSTDGYVSSEADIPQMGADIVRPLGS